MKSDLQITFFFLLTVLYYQNVKIKSAIKACHLITIKEFTGLFIQWEVPSSSTVLVLNAVISINMIVSLIPNQKRSRFIQVHNPYLSLVRAASMAWHLQRDKVCWSKCVWEHNWNPPKDAHGKCTAVVRKNHHRHSYHSSHWWIDQHILSAKNSWDVAQTLYHNLLHTVIQCTHMGLRGL